MSAPEGTIDEATFRSVLGRFATGVVTVCATVEAGMVGMSVNSFTSVSLDPPLVAFCAAHSSATWAEMRHAEAVAVSILAASQEELCRQFARKGTDRFSGVIMRVSPGGAPIVDQCLAWLECQVVDRHEAGDHDIVVGRVTALELGSAGDDAEPLLFFNSRFVGVAQ